MQSTDVLEDRDEDEWNKVLIPLLYDEITFMELLLSKFAFYLQKFVLIVFVNIWEHTLI